MEEIYKNLTNKDEKAAYEYMKYISSESAKSDKYLEMISVFVSMMSEENSYVRTRGFILICSQSRWANNNQIKNVFEKMVPLLNDPKPTVIRQCLKALHEVVLYRPEMTQEIKQAIKTIDLSNYRDSMLSLIKKDIEELMKKID